MGYTHYWYREQEIEKKTFAAIAKDFKILLPKFAELGIKLGDGIGTGEPVITDSKIIFNGLTKCGHPQNAAIVIPWPAENAGGVATYKETESGKAKTGNWFAGAVIDKRVCDGDCSYETFSFPRTMKIDPKWQKPDERHGLYFDCTKTAFRPYDLAVTAALVIAQHHLKDKIRVSSDGELQHWFDAMMMCKTSLGYGLDFKLPEE